MNKYIFLVLILSTNDYSISQSAAQIQNGSYISIKTGYLSIQDYSPLFYGGLELDIRLGGVIGIHYSLVFSKEYHHLYAGPKAAINIIKTTNKSNLNKFDNEENNPLGFLIIGILIPEGISINLHYNQNITLSPYISPFQYEHFSGSADSFFGGALGMKIKTLIKKGKIQISPYLEYKIHYNEDKHPGISAGINIGFYLGGGSSYYQPNSLRRKKR